MGDRPTEMMPGGSSFPTTQWSRILRARDSADPKYREGLEQILRQYWKPVYVYIRRAWGKSNEDAKDLTQGFFMEMLEHDLIARFAPERGRFRTFLKTALRHFLTDEQRSAGRQKRGGGRAAIPIDDDTAPLDEIASAPENQSPDACFDRAWANELLAAAVRDLLESLRAESREIAWRAFELYDLSPPPGDPVGYRDVASRLQVSEAQVKVDLAYARQKLRQILTDRVRAYVENEADVLREVTEILTL